MFIAIAMICADDPTIGCSMYLWPESFVVVELCDTFVAESLYTVTPMGLVTHVGCFDLSLLDEDA